MGRRRKDQVRDARGWTKPHKRQAPAASHVLRCRRCQRQFGEAQTFGHRPGESTWTWCPHCGAVVRFTVHA